MNKDTLLQQIDSLKTELDRYRQNDNQRIKEALETEYTYESNRIEGNTLTLMETELVIHKGLTISGKPLKDHLEAINHTHALDFIKDLAKNKEPFTEPVLLDIHRLILRSINDQYAGKYRDVQVLISGSEFVPPQPFLVPKQMEDYFRFYNEQKDSLHPVELSAELHERLVTIHPFIDGNGRTARLIMNLILIRNGYPIAILKGDSETRLKYYKALETAQTGGNKTDFILLVADTVKQALEKYLGILRT
ncbi:Fic family protein [Pedobacter sp. BS3]|uniref:Fic family protein n=1 Tax=Pedobacter sp. BS3 TaxID=2567937 RepID=UPI0011EBAE85|nr:Fic family protein [Pedobacter sp. BS3]TZF83252.1 Fic family protein [Pedobacter sp. BS3]